MVDEEDRQLVTRDLFDSLELIESGLAITDNAALLQEIQCLEEKADQSGFHVLARLAAELRERLKSPSAAPPAGFLDRMRDALEGAEADGASAPPDAKLAPVGAQRAA